MRPASHTAIGMLAVSIYMRYDSKTRVSTIIIKALLKGDILYLQTCHLYSHKDIKSIPKLTFELMTQVCQERALVAQQRIYADN